MKAARSKSGTRALLNLDSAVASAGKKSLLVNVGHLHTHCMRWRHIDEGVAHAHTLSLNEQLIRELMSMTAEKTRTEAIHRAAAEVIRRKKLDQLRSSSGAIHLDLDWKSLDQAEIRHQVALKRHRHGHR